MAIITTRNESFMVIDDVLRSEDFACLLRDVQGLRYNYPTGEWNKVWQISDPQMVSSGSFYWSRRPINHGMDLIASEFIKAINESQFYGAEGESWADIGFRVYQQGRGSKLTCHSDSPQYVGAGVYYCHPEWSSSWGGELLFPDIPPPSELAKQAMGANASMAALEERLKYFSSGRYIAPKPNRMVLINSGVLHSTNRVDPDAGNHIRTSISAFILRKEQTALLVENKFNIGD